MIKGALIGDTTALTRIDKVSVNVIAKVKAAVLREVHGLARYIVEQKLSGQVLKVRTNNLRSSVRRGVGVVETANAVIGTVGLGAAGAKVAKYGAAHEYGAEIPARVVVPTKRSALKFTMGGKTVFAKRVNIPAFKLPMRSFMRSSLAERREAMMLNINTAAKNAAREAVQ